MSGNKLGSSTTLNQMSGKSLLMQLLRPENHQLKLDSYINHVSTAFMYWRQLFGSCLSDMESSFQNDCRVTSFHPHSSGSVLEHLEKSIPMQNKNAVKQTNSVV